MGQQFTVVFGFTTPTEINGGLVVYSSMGVIYRCALNNSQKLTKDGK